MLHDLQEIIELCDDPNLDSSCDKANVESKGTPSKNLIHIISINKVNKQYIE